MEQINRRNFVLGSLAAPAIATGAFGSPSDRIRVAVVGFKGRGRSHIEGFSALPNVEVAALCDIDESVLAKGVKSLEGKSKPATYTDIRKLLEDKSIDAIATATPNHWHALATVWACQAGKDVYVEKPACHNAFEGRKMVEAARRYKRIVQVGTQSRSSAAVQEGVRKLREGVIGDVYMARALCFKWRDTIGRKDDGPVPKGIHYDLWIGPAPARPFNENRFHYVWHWNWDYGNGDIGNQGIHQMDLARWGLGVKFPVKAQSLGGHFMFDDDQQTPNVQVATFTFDEGGKKKFLVFEVRHWISNHEAGIGESKGEGGNTIGNLFYGSKGYMVLGEGGYRTFLGKNQEPGPTAKGGGNHFDNFIKAMRSRKAEDLTADVEEGYRSAVLVHLANASYRTGRAVNFDPATEQVVGDPEAAKLMTRVYRKPFVVPEKV
jgi:predicted dehydrogenase